MSINLDRSSIGLEFGSTRIKAVLLDENNKMVASGSFEWENKLEHGVWTYSLDDAVRGMQLCYAMLAADFRQKYSAVLDHVGAIGVSAMMHGYIALDRDMNLLSPFRTWRNTMTESEAEELSALFGFNIPQRWTIAHLYQCMKTGQEHVKKIAHLSTLAVYINYLLTGKWIAGTGEASGIFPVDTKTLDYDSEMLRKFDDVAHSMGYSFSLRDIIPQTFPAGSMKAYLTEEGASLLDLSGALGSGIPVAPPEGDACTGLVATNSVRPGTVNVSAGTSCFAMFVTDKDTDPHKEISCVKTPSGRPVAMVHCSNCTSDINSWAGLFREFASRIGSDISEGKLFDTLFGIALEGEPDCGGLVSYNLYSGEISLGTNDGRPVFARSADARFCLANFMRANLSSCLAILKAGMEVLKNEKNIRIDRLYAHGGYFKTLGVGQRLLSAAFNVPVSVMETAGEGGPYGMALLASYMINRKSDQELEDFLDDDVFCGTKCTTLMASAEEVEGMEKYTQLFLSALDIEKKAIEKV